jgi:DNA-binding NtrC family response regulator
MTEAAPVRRAQVLVVDDKESVLDLMARILGEAYDVTTAADPRKAMVLLRDVAFDVLLTDIRMPQATGFDLLAAARRCAEPPRVVMITGYASIPDAVEAMRQGAFDYVAKPLEAEEIALVVARALQGPAPAADGAAGANGVARANGASHAGGAGHAEPVIPPDPVEGVDTVFHDAVAAARDRASRDYLLALMRHFHGNVTQAARRAGMTRESLHRLLRKYEVHSESFKASGR